MIYENQSTIAGEFYNSEFEETYLSENEFTKEVPSYIRDYPKFWRLMRIFSNYIQQASVVMKYILENLKLENASGDILNQIAKRYGIEVEFPVNADGTYDLSTHDAILKFAIIGHGIQKGSAGDRSTFNNIRRLLPNIKAINVDDYRNDPDAPSEKPMAVSVEFIGYNPYIDYNIIHKHLVPDVTGVLMSVSYLRLGGTYFGFDLDHENPPDTDAYEVAGWDEGNWAATKLK